MLEKDEMIFEVIERAHWNYFLSLEDEMLEIRKYVDFNEKNFNTFSMKFMKLHLAVCSEIDTFAKVLANQIHPKLLKLDESPSITKWWYLIQDWYDEIDHKTVRALNSLDLNPWNNFRVEPNRNKKNCYKLIEGYKTPSWWTAYNDLKHKRTIVRKGRKSNFETANLGNVCNAFAGLYILEKNCLMQLGSNTQLGKRSRSKMFENDIAIYVDESQEALIIE